MIIARKNIAGTKNIIYQVLIVRQKYFFRIFMYITWTFSAYLKVFRVIKIKLGTFVRHETKELFQYLIFKNKLNVFEKKHRMLF